MESNIFTKIISGAIPSISIYEDEDFKAILDISPGNLGHALILPKYEAEDIFGLPDHVSSKILPLAAKIARAMKTALNFDGLNIVQNNGSAAGQTIAYYHLHIIPRYNNDNVGVGWTQKSVLQKDLSDTAAEIKKQLC